MPQHANAPLVYQLGHFEILETLGAGGMGVVYRARDLNLGRVVALKVLRDDLQSEKHIVARFQREAEACAALNHPRIVHIYGVGKAGGVPYMAMELIEGEPLSAWLRSQGPMPWAQALRTARQIAEALSAAHEAKIIHRDIKPGNILLDRDGNACVTDFGIAKVLTAAVKLTFDGARLGTPQYMSPERREDREVTPASDFYSLGVVLFQMLTGQTPFDKTPDPGGQDFAVSLKPPRRLEEVMPEAPPMVCRLVAWLLEANPRHRPQDGASLMAFIDAALAGKTGTGASAHEVPTPVTPLESEAPTVALTPAGRGTPREEGAGAGVFRRFRVCFGIGAALALTLGALFTLRLGAGPMATHHLPAWTDAPDAVFKAGHLLRHRAETETVSVLRMPGRAFSAVDIFAAPGGAFAVVQRDGEAASPQQGLLFLSGDGSGGMEVLPPGAARATLLGSMGTGRDARVLFGGQDGAWLYRSGQGYGRLSTLPVGAGALSSAADRMALVQRTVDGKDRIVLAALSTPWDYSVLYESSHGIGMVAFDLSGTRLLAQETTENGNVVREWPLDTLGAAPRVRYRGAGTLGAAGVCPDGEMLALTEVKDGVSEVIVVTGDGDKVWAFGEGWSPAWGTDRETLYFLAPDRAGRVQAWAVPVAEGGSGRQLTHLGAGLGAGLAVDASGRRAFAGLAEGAFAVIDLTR